MSWYMAATHDTSSWQAYVLQNAGFHTCSMSICQEDCLACLHIYPLFATAAEDRLLLHTVLRT